MNIYLIVVLAIIILDYLLELIIETLNLKHLNPELPEEFKDYYQEDKYTKSQKYTKEKTKLGLIQSTLSVIFIIPFILLGGFNYIDRFVRGFGSTEFITGLLFFLILMIASIILSKPFEIYDTFVIEEKYGFNKTTPKTFIIDFFKNLIVSIIIGCILISLILWLFGTFGEFAWLFTWGAITLFMVLLIFLYPAVIMPLFNKFTPLEDCELKETIKIYAEDHDLKMKGIYRMDASKRSSKTNAFFGGFGKFRRIVLYDTLIKNHSIDEILTILAHEVGHFKLKHIIKGILISILSIGFMLFILSFFINNKGLFQAFGMEHLSIYASIVFFMYLYTPISKVLSIGRNVHTRKCEYEADNFAVKTTNKSDNFITALKKLSVDNLANLTPHPLKVFIKYSHPPILKRIFVIRKFQK